MRAAMATGTQTQKTSPHIKGLQSALVAYWQAYFTDMFIGER